MAEESPRKLKLKRIAALRSERSSWIDQYREISQYQQPRLGRFLVSDTNQGVKRYNSIYDNTAIIANRTLSAGMMSGMTSPARPWFRLALADKDLMKAGPVKTWLYKCEVLIRAVFTHSNTYRALHQIYEELGLFGTAATVVLPNFANVMHHYPLTCGEYSCATDSEGKVNTLGREFQLTVGQIAEQFGTTNMSQAVRNLFQRNSLEAWVPVVHLIEPRKARDLSKRDNLNMKFASCYMEAGGNEDKMLSESGFEDFPALVPRWAVTGNDVYGSGPGMEAQGDVKQLQHEQLRKSQAIDYQVNPPLQVPSAYKDAAKNRLPGGVMFVDQTGQGQGVRSAFEVNLNLQHLMEDIQDVRQRIRSVYYADLFLMLANDTRSGVTATEVAERHEEKLLMLGPVLERLHNELLQPLIDIAFDFCDKAGILPPPPNELPPGTDMNVEFVSTLAQAQRMVAAQGLDRLMGTVGTMAQLNPGVLDKVKFDDVVDEYADLYGTNPELIASDEEVAPVRAARAKQQAAAAAAATAPAVADTVKTLGDTNPDGVSDVMSRVQGYSTPGQV